MTRRILLINYEFPPVGAGAGNATANIARCLADQGADVLVLTAAYGDLPAQERRDGYRVWRVPAVRRRVDQCSPLEMLTFMAGAVIPTLAAGLQWRPHVACAFFGVPSGPLALILRLGFGVPYLVSLRGGDVPGFLGRELALLHGLTMPLTKAVWWQSAGLVANSPGLAELARRSWHDAPVDLIANGVDIEAFTPPARERPSVPLRLLSVGRLAGQKGLTYLLEALSLCQSQVTLRLVGDGPDRASLEAAARRAALANRVTFTGWVDRPSLPTHYQWADAFVLPSLDEGMPNVVLEAQASGLAVIGTDVPGTRDLIRPGQNGYLVPPRDPRSIASAIDRLVEEPASLRALGGRAREDACARSWKSVADRYAMAFGRAIANDGARWSDRVRPAPALASEVH